MRLLFFIALFTCISIQVSAKSSVDLIRERFASVNLSSAQKQIESFFNPPVSEFRITRKEIEIYYIPTLFKKVMNKKHFLGPEHVNSGFTLHNSHIVITS